MRFFYTTANPFERLRVLEEQHEAIAAEVPPFDTNAITIKRLHKDWHNTGDEAAWAEFVARLESNRAWIGGWDGQAWFNFPLLIGGKAVGAAEELCPTTLKLLKGIAGVNVAGFALLLPHSKLPVHTDTTGYHYNSAAFNMLLSGSNSTLHVGPEDTHDHKKGVAVIFNSEYPHSARNNGDSNRVILYLDFVLKLGQTTPLPAKEGGSEIHRV
jgi:beta-hydroxylase